MGWFFFVTLLLSLSIAGLVRPWIGVVGAYGFVLLQPQAIWFWNFDGLRPALWILLPTLTGFLSAAVRGKYALRAVANRRNAYMLTLWTFFGMSYLFGEYVDGASPYRFTDPGWAMESVSKMLLLYFVACLSIDSEKKLRALSWVLVGASVYLVYWANAQYLSGYVMGRLQGPVGPNEPGTYSDENAFALIFVVSQPFLWHMGLAANNRLLRWAMWLAIPFAWHAVFLTASRGALVGLVVVTGLMALRSRLRLLGLALVPAFVIAYQWQAGDLMKSRADTIDEFRTETSAATRLEAWEAATGMIAAHPIVGVGLASFGVAFPDFSDAQPREAHNTFFQIAAESGAIAGAMYLFLMLGAIAALWRNGRRLAVRDGPGHHGYLHAMNEATLAALVGLAICSLFLSLQLYEIVYLFLAMASVLLFIAEGELPSAASASGRPVPARRPNAENAGAGRRVGPSSGLNPSIALRNGGSAAKHRLAGRRTALGNFHGSSHGARKR